MKYYRTTSSILAKIGSKNNAAISLKTIASMALPTLTYSIESLALNNSELLCFKSFLGESFFQKFF